MNGAARRRRGGASLALVTDLVRWSWRTRRWMLAFIVAATALSLTLGATVQYTVPWAVYGGL